MTINVILGQNSSTLASAGIREPWSECHYLAGTSPGTPRDACREHSRLFSQPLAKNAASLAEPGASAQQFSLVLGLGIGVEDISSCPGLHQLLEPRCVWRSAPLPCENCCFHPPRLNALQDKQQSLLQSVGCRTIAPVYSPESSFHMGFYLQHWTINIYHMGTHGKILPCRSTI